MRQELRIQLLKSTWDRVGACWPKKFALEPFEGAAAAHAHREYWRPPRIRLLLLAESHVFTNTAETMSRVDIARVVGGVETPPDPFVRLVYCLAYGEAGLVTPTIAPNAGTPQYWRLFAACVGSSLDATVLKGEEPDPKRRLRSKVSVLSEMRRRGIWLADASITALYDPGARAKPDAEVLRHAVTTSWRYYWREVLASERPAHVVVIGRMVHRSLAAELRETFGENVTVIRQPAAFLTRQQREDDLRTLREMADKHAPAR